MSSGPRGRPTCMTAHTVVSPAEWREALAEHRAKEKAAMRASDALAAERRRLPMVAFDGDYAFDGPDGPVGLPELFEGRTQLIVYHFMFDPGDDPCVGCTMFTDNVVHLAHLHARDTSFALVSRSPRKELEAYRRRMGWDVPWYSAIGEEFQADAGITTGFGLSVFVRDGHTIGRTYFTSGRGVEPLGTVWSLLDVTPYGRQEAWQDAPAGTPQGPPYTWWRRHDEYEEAPG
jgi:predicted dithiol-disulfide oxidoreductase (DUF899 family)